MRIALGRLFGTDIYMTPGFLLLLGFWTFTAGNVGVGAIWAVAVILSLLVHEFGHVFAVRRWLDTESLVLLWGLGGLCIYPKRPETPGRQIAISLMGPAFGLVLGLLAFAAVKLTTMPHPVVQLFVEFLAVIGIFWTVANLLPIVPLDGGQAFRAALALKLHPMRAEKVARVVSILFAGAALAAALALGEMWIALISGLLLLQNLHGSPVAYH